VESSTCRSNSKSRCTATVRILTGRTFLSSRGEMTADDFEVTPGGRGQSIIVIMGRGDSRNDAFTTVIIRLYQLKTSILLFVRVRRYTSHERERTRGATPYQPVHTLRRRQRPRMPRSVGGARFTGLRSRQKRTILLYHRTLLPVITSIRCYERLYTF